MASSFSVQSAFENECMEERKEDRGTSLILNVYNGSPR